MSLANHPRLFRTCVWVTFFVVMGIVAAIASKSIDIYGSIPTVIVGLAIAFAMGLYFDRRDKRLGRL